MNVYDFDFSMANTTSKLSINERSLEFDAYSEHVKDYGRCGGGFNCSGGGGQCGGGFNCTGGGGQCGGGFNCSGS